MNESERVCRMAKNVLDKCIDMNFMLCRNEFAVCNAKRLVSSMNWHEYVCTENDMVEAD